MSFLDPTANVETETARIEAQGSEWPEDINTLAGDGPPPSVDLSAMLPPALGRLRDYIEGLAEELQVPVEMPLVGSVAVASLATSRAFKVAAYGENGLEPAPLWFCLLADPGSRKTAVKERVIEPITFWQKMYFEERLKKPLARYAEKRKGLEARLAEVRRKIAKDGLEEESEEERDRLVDELADMPELFPPDLVTSDPTPEALRHLLARNGEKILVASDENAALENVMGRYSKGANFDLWNNMHAGGFSSIHRSSNTAVHLEDPAGSVLLYVQPGAVEDILSDRKAEGVGMLARFLWISPESTVGHRAINPPSVDTEAEKWYKLTIGRLLSRPWPGKVMLEVDAPKQIKSAPTVIRLSEDAREMFDRMREENEVDLQHGDAGWRMFGSKLPGAIARIALSMHTMINPQIVEIDSDTMKAALAWRPFLIGHWKRVVGAATDPAMVAALKAWSWMQKQGEQSCRTRDLYDAVRTKTAPLDRMDGWMPALDILEARGYIRRIREQTGGRPSETIEINPFAGFAGIARDTQSQN
ncbi:MAG: YfjI family protein [Verrucomicrobiales bacterium]